MSTQRSWIWQGHEVFGQTWRGHEHCQQKSVKRGADMDTSFPWRGPEHRNGVSEKT